MGIPRSLPTGRKVGPSGVGMGGLDRARQVKHWPQSQAFSLGTAGPRGKDRQVSPAPVNAAVMHKFPSSGRARARLPLPRDSL